MTETKRYYSLPVDGDKPALAVGWAWLGEPRMQLTMSTKEKSHTSRRLLTPEEVLNLKAACSQFLQEHEQRENGMGGGRPISKL